MHNSLQEAAARDWPSGAPPLMDRSVSRFRLLYTLLELPYYGVVHFRLFLVREGSGDGDLTLNSQRRRRRCQVHSQVGLGLGQGEGIRFYYHSEHCHRQIPHQD